MKKDKKKLLAMKKTGQKLSGCGSAFTAVSPIFEMMC